MFRQRAAQALSHVLRDKARRVEFAVLYARPDAFLCVLPKANAAARTISPPYIANFYFQFYFAKSRP
jgi:hypothetical protein